MIRPYGRRLIKGLADLQQDMEDLSHAMEMLTDEEPIQMKSQANRTTSEKQDRIRQLYGKLVSHILQFRHFGFWPGKEMLILFFVAVGIVAIVVFPQNEYLKRLSDSSTPILALLTAAYVVLTWLLLRSAQVTADEQHRPFVVATLPIHSLRVFCRIENLGDRPAYSVAVTFTPPLQTLFGDGIFKGTAEPLLSQKFLPPHVKIHNMVSTTVHTLPAPAEAKVFSVTVEYSDAKGKRFHDSYTIDMNSYLFEKKFIINELEDHVEEIGKQLSEIKNVLDKNLVRGA